MRKASAIADVLFKVIVTANLVFINYCFFEAYDQLKGKLAFMKGEMALQLEERLNEEFNYVRKDMGELKGDILESQQKLIPLPTQIRTGLPIPR